MKSIFSTIKPILPYGCFVSWDDLNFDPKLYHAVHIYWMKFYGLWYNSHSWNTILFWLKLSYSVIVLWLVCFLPCTGEILYLLKRRENIGDIAEGLYLFLSEMYTYFKLAVVWMNKDKVLALLKYLHREEFKPKEWEHREIMRKSINTARSVMTYYSSMCVGAVSVGILMPLAENFKILPTNVEYPFFNAYESPAYEVLYVHHIYYKPATCIIDGVMDTILASFIASAIAQIDVLVFNLENIEKVVKRRKENADRKNLPNFSQEFWTRDLLRECIIHHNSIIRYVSMIESTFSLSSALQFMLSGMVLCLVGVQFLSIENPASHPVQISWMAIYLTCMLTEVFIICWFGNELIWKSGYIKHAAFNSNWVAMSEPNKVYLKILMERSQRPLRVTAGKIFILSLDTYTVLINWSYKAFAVMSNMKK